MSAGLPLPCHFLRLRSHSSLDGEKFIGVPGGVGGWVGGRVCHFIRGWGGGGTILSFLLGQYNGTSNRHYLQALLTIELGKGSILAFSSDRVVTFN